MKKINNLLLAGLLAVLGVSLSSCDGAEPNGDKNMGELMNGTWMQVIGSYRAYDLPYDFFDGDYYGDPDEADDYVTYTYTFSTINKADTVNVPVFPDFDGKFSITYAYSDVNKISYTVELDGEWTVDDYNLTMAVTYIYITATYNSAGETVTDEFPVEFDADDCYYLIGTYSTDLNVYTFDFDSFEGPDQLVQAEQQIILTKRQ